MNIISNDINQALTHLRDDSLVAVPTETVYGLAGDAENATAIKKIFTLKNRPLTHPLSMLIAKEWDLSTWVKFVPNYADILIQHFWPGPLTLVFSCKKNAINPLVNAGNPTIAIRCPNHPLTYKLLTKFTTPLVAPSANPFGGISPTTARHVLEGFPDASIFILDGGRCQLGIESTIIDVTNPNTYTILRQGIIDELTIKTLLPKIPPNTTLANKHASKHYQSEKPIYCFENLQQLKQFCQNKDDLVYVISFTQPFTLTNKLSYKFPENPQDVAFEFYNQLRIANSSNANYIAIELPPKDKCWKAIQDCLLKNCVNQ